MATSVIQLVITGRDLSGKQLKSASKNVDALGASMQKTGLIAAGVGAAISGALLFAVKEAAAVEAGVTNALTLVDQTVKEFEAMKMDMTTLAQNLAQELGVSAKDISVGFYQVLSAGAEAMSADFLNLTATALKLAKLVGLSTSESVEGLADTLNAFGFELAEAERVADIFFTTSKLVATTVPQLTEAMKNAGPTAAALGVDLESVAVALAALAKSGTKASEAGVGFRQIMLKLAAPTAEASSELARLNISLFDENQEMRDLLDVFQELGEATGAMTAQQRAASLESLVGVRAFTKLAIIVNTNNDMMRDWRQTLFDGGTMQRAFTTRMSSMQGQLEITRETFQVLRGVIGQALLPTLAKLITSIRPTVIAWTDWARANQDVILGLGKLGAHLLTGGLLLAGLGTMLRLINLLKVGLISLNPAMLVIVGTMTILGIGIQKVADSFLNATKAINEFQQEAEQQERGDIEKAYHEAGDAAGRLQKRYDELKKGMRSLSGATDSQIKELMRVGIQLQDANDKAVGYGLALQALNKIAGKAFNDENAKKSEANTRAMLDAKIVVRRLAEELRGLGGIEILNEEQKEIFNDIINLYPQAAELLDKLAAQGTVAKLNWEGVKIEVQQALAAAQDIDQLSVPEADMTSAFTDVDIQEVRATASMIAGAFNSGFQQILVKTTKFRDVFTAIWKSIASSVISALSRIAAEYLALKLFTTAFNPGSLLGFSPLSIVGLSHGGEVVSGVPGRDTQRALLSQGELVVDNDTTDRLKDFLDDGGGGVTMVINAGLYTGTDQENQRTMQFFQREQGTFERRAIAKGAR